MDWKVYVEYRPDMLSTFVYVTRRIAEDKVEVLVKGGDETKVVDPRSAVQKDAHFARFEDDFIVSLLVEALDKKGIKAPLQSFTEGKLQATEAHLADLRMMIPRLTH